MGIRLGRGVNTADSRLAKPQSPMARAQKIELAYNQVPIPLTQFLVLLT
jgi:hypothetical protein